MKRTFAGLILAVVLSGCGSLLERLDNPPSMEPPDHYVSGMRWFHHKNYKWARKDWEPLAQDGDCDAQYRMGTLYFLGAGVPRDYVAARRWWLKAANQGQSFAQALLATMDAHDSMAIMTIGTETWFDCTGGCGTVKDMPAAYRWMRLSEKCAVYDDTRRAARVSAERYQKSLTAEQVAEVDQFVKAWKPPRDACVPRELY